VRILSILKVLGSNIKRIRINKKISQIKLSKLLNYAEPATLTRIEQGKSGMSLRKVEEVAKVLDIDVYELFLDKIDSERFNALKLLEILKRTNSSLLENFAKVSEVSEFFKEYGEIVEKFNVLTGAISKEIKK
jgi:transcriptional regulator with XRE-family HTH domain